MKTSFNDRHSRLIIALGVGALVLALVLLVALLVHAAGGDDSSQHTGRCAPALAGTVDPVTCLPYGQPGAAAVPPTNHSGSSAQRPKAPAVKAPAPKAPAPKAPAAPKAPVAPKAPAAPPAVSLGKR
ncbi:hypothetical protein ACFW5V_32500 [Streptomyces sp. NPDC058762]|uniref:hypothetical protein n=1 Tax=Streptomyces sp. NPDC058762 TaxID=3346629 RepID=UPI00368E6734